MARPQYIIPVLLKYLYNQDRNCPHCGSASTRRIGSKFFIIQLRKCATCGLLFRWPKDDPKDNGHFYSGIYREKSGLTTNLPSPDELASLLSNHFKGSDKDFAERIAILQKYKPAGKLLDYGASWGYGTWQFQAAGYDSIGYEIDSDRASYGNKNLEIRVLTDRTALALLPMEHFDVVFTGHVLEHLPDLHTVFRDFQRLLKPGGILFVFVPNCNGMERPDIFRSKKIFAFGESHTFAFTGEFFNNNLPNYGFQLERIDTEPYSISVPPKEPGHGVELMIIARKQPDESTVGNLD